MAFTVTQFLDRIHSDVIQDMHNTKILASLTAAQALIESNKGNSGLTVQCNNLFGIKGEYNGQFGIFWTTEYYNGVKTRVQAKFRKYPSWKESIADHSRLFTSSKRYKNLVGCTDYALACKYVKEDGYATSPSYTNTLMNTINTYKLYLWDKEVVPSIKAVKKIPPVLPTLKKGSKGSYVLSWQQYLWLNGFPVGLVDGKFGQLTEDAVKAFQFSRGLTVDGIIGPEMWNSIGVTEDISAA